ncbi:peptidoglycan recognition protein family protein [Oceanobacillus halotolerans]|uniref:peptidoglycan recognition protein family protein n=1 Tax=Oceanobacillus halotolerans TaxID=2663380 RepID=UPI0013DB10E8|nr:N-acetylmuramoyl-L-alanine amidase [Oceanobacillus halotolerans]
MAGFVDIPNFVDYREQVKRHATKKYPVLQVTDKTTIAIHHSLTKQDAGGSNARGYARYHVDTHDWPSIGYHYVIEPDGTVKFCNDIETRAYHVGDYNNEAVGVCLTGDFRTEEPTEAQKESLRQLVSALQQDFTHLKHVKGHNEFSGYEWKQCPEFDYRAVLNETPSNTSSTTNDDQSAASTGSTSIRSIQRTLNKRYILSIAEDGIYGPETKRALIKGYQTELNKQFNSELAVDGIWGPNTRSATVNVQKGAQGNITWILQATLFCQGYELAVDGIFGNETESTVHEFQRDHELSIDGIAGKNTFAALFG